MDATVLPGPDDLFKLMLVLVISGSRTIEDLLSAKFSQENYDYWLKASKEASKFLGSATALGLINPADVQEAFRRIGGVELELGRNDRPGDSGHHK